MSQKTKFNKILCISLESFRKIDEPLDLSLGRYPTLLLIPLTQEFLEYITQLKDKAINIFKENNDNYLMYPLKVSFISLGFSFATTVELASKSLQIPEEELEHLEYEDQDENSFKIIELPFTYKSLDEFYLKTTEKYQEEYSPLFYPIEGTTFTFRNPLLMTETIFLEILTKSRYQDNFYFYTKSLELFELFYCYKNKLSEPIDEF